MRVRAFHPIYCTGEAISHISLSLCRFMRQPGVDVELFFPAADAACRTEYMRTAIPILFKSAAYRLASEEQLTNFAARKFLDTLEPSDLVYLWPGAPLWLYWTVKSRGHRLVMERINCHRRVARRILDDAYRRLGIPPTHDLNGQAMAWESQKLLMADWVFCPSPNVAQSMIESGVGPEKILRSSYGWDPDRIRDTRPALPQTDGVTFLFVGRVCVRKGAHLLLKAWSRAGLRGRLVFVGRMDAEIAAAFRTELARPDVIALPHMDEVARAYACADAFVFPTLEEGSPLVVYEALAAGLPVITTRMGAGEVVRDGVEGAVLEAYDEDAWVDRLRSLADARDALRRQGDACRARADEFTWERVGKSRGRILLNAGAAPADVPWSRSA